MSRTSSQDRAQRTPDDIVELETNEPAGSERAALERYLGGLHPPSVALIDFGNVCPKPDEASHVDALDLIAEMIRDVVSYYLGNRSGTHEVDCRFYGGFRDRAGGATGRRHWLVRHIDRVRGIKRNIRLVPGIAESIICAPEAILVGTFVNGGQKMVDAMIAEDAATFARSKNASSLLLISDDEDFLPVVLSISRQTTTPLFWMRQRQVGNNDRWLQDAVVLLQDGRWQ